MTNTLSDLGKANIGFSKMENQSEFSSFKKKTRGVIIFSVPLLQEMSVFHFWKAFLNRGVSSISTLPNLLPKIGKQVTLLCPGRRRPEPGRRDKIPAGSRTPPAFLSQMEVQHPLSKALFSYSHSFLIYHLSINGINVYQ